MSDRAVDRGSLRLGSRVLAWGTRTFVMGVLNVTPDSFSGDGVARDAEALRARIDTLLDAAPDVIDVGGESTRPGAAEVPVREELGRITPALEALHDRAPDMPLSIDTRKAAVAHAALDLGAVMVNDVTGGRHDPEILEVDRRGWRRLCCYSQSSRRGPAVRDRPASGIRGLRRSGA